MLAGFEPRNLVVLKVVGSLALLISTGCSCVPTPATSREGKNTGGTEQKSTKQSAKSQQPTSDSLDSPMTGSRGGGEPLARSQESAADPKGGDSAGSGGNSPEIRPKNGTTQPGLSSLAEGLFGKPSATKEQMSPAEAHSKATSLEREAIDFEKQGRKAEAFERALEGWQLVRVHDEDAACCGLAQQLEPILERLGEAANTSKVRATGKPLQVQ